MERYHPQFLILKKHIMAKQQFIKGSKVIWEGTSSYNGEKIAVIMTGLESGSTNTKTGAMVQTYIILQDVHPLEAVKDGQDVAICGDCKHRPSLAKETDEARCYVEVGKGASQVWKAYKRDRYERISLDEAKELVRGKNVRFGTYGDPCVAPIEVFKALAETCKGRTGYTHRWMDKGFNPEWKTLVMASVDNVFEKLVADDMGMRYFRVEIGTQTPLQGEVRCPASKEAGFKTTCTNCRLCSGNAVKAKSIVISDHGLGHQSRAKKLQTI
jgi:hypothetical protein